MTQTRRAGAGGATPFTEYRADGWPLCPWCGEDELWSNFMEKPPDYTGTLEQYLACELRCYLCNWSRPAGKVHASDCAVHNEPAMPNGPCNCGAQP